MESKFTEIVKVRIPEEMLKDVQSLASSRMLAGSDIIRQAIREFIDKNQPATPQKNFGRKR